MKDIFSKKSRRMQSSAFRRMTRLASAAGPDLISFAGGMPNPHTFPLDQLAEYATSEIQDQKGKSLQYGSTLGYRKLIHWISEYCEKKEIKSLPENIICTTGSQQALDLISSILIEPGDSVFLETPTYLGAIAAFRNSGAQMVSVSQDQHGIVPEDLRDKLNATPPEKRKLIYLTSNFQNPSGISIHADRRKIIAAMLEEFDVHLIEDDPYGEIYFDEFNEPPPPIKKESPDRVIYLGTFSKIVAPTFRTGWVVANSEIVEILELAKEAADLCGSMLDQRILYRFCSSSFFPEHLRLLRSFYRERWKAMEEALKKEMAANKSWTQPTGGFFIWLTLPQEQDSESFLEEAISVSKVSYMVGQPFSCDGTDRNHLRLAFSVENPDRIEEGIRRLAKVFR
jgi:2-aminoadipate transaminase